MVEDRHGTRVCGAQGLFNQVAGEPPVVNTSSSAAIMSGLVITGRLDRSAGSSRSMSIPAKRRRWKGEWVTAWVSSRRSPVRWAPWSCSVLHVSRWRCSGIPASSAVWNRVPQPLPTGLQGLGHWGFLGVVVSAATVDGPQVAWGREWRLGRVGQPEGVGHESDGVLQVERSRAGQEFHEQAGAQREQERRH
jgi:hypothetical protein